jgi:HSP20 family protein
MNMALVKHESKQLEPAFDRFDRMTDRLFDDWLTALPFRRPSQWRWMSDEVIRVDEYQENGTLVVKAELPGIDPDKDVELTVSDGMLHIRAERREEEKTEERGYLRQELRYGSFSRTLPLPSGASEDDVKASYHDGILEVRVPAPAAPEAKKVPITKT